MKQNEITIFTVPDTGVKLPIRKVSPRLIQEIEKQLRKEMPAPKPPTQTVDYGSGPVEEPNPAHPDYLKAVDEYKQGFNLELSERTQKLLISRGILPFLTLSEDQLNQVCELREQMKANFGVDLPADDKAVFVEMLALGSVEDLTDLTNELIRRSTATEAGIGEHLAKF